MTTIAFSYNTAIFGTIARLILDAYHRVVEFPMNHASRTRAERQLNAMDDRLLADIGVERGDIHQMVWGR